MSRNEGESLVTPDRVGMMDSAVYAQGVESGNTSSVPLSLSELNDFDNTGRRAGLTAGQVTRFTAKIQCGRGCWEWQGARLPRGYGMFHAGRWLNGKQDTRYAHRVMWALVNGPIPGGMGVLHACDNPPCCNPAHLSLGTQADNLCDASRKGRLPKERPGAWKHGAVRRAVLEAALVGPRGTLSRLCGEYGLNLKSMAVALYRARRRRGVIGHAA